MKEARSLAALQAFAIYGGIALAVKFDAPL